MTTTCIILKLIFNVTDANAKITMMYLNLRKRNFTINLPNTLRKYGITAHFKVFGFDVIHNEQIKQKRSEIGCIKYLLKKFRDQKSNRIGTIRTTRVTLLLLENDILYCKT